MRKHRRHLRVAFSLSNNDRDVSVRSLRLDLSIEPVAVNDSSKAHTLAGAGKASGKLAAHRLAGQEIYFNKAVRKAARLSEYVHLIESDEKADPTCQ